MTVRIPGVLAAVAAMTLGVSARAQCIPRLGPFDASTGGFPGVFARFGMLGVPPTPQAERGSVSATTLWDPDGPGPATPKLVVAGKFTIAGDAYANNVALYDPGTGRWAALGAGLNFLGGDTTIRAIAASPSGELIAAGQVDYFGDLPPTAGSIQPIIRRWDGSSWTSLASAPGWVGNSVTALAVLPNGKVVAGVAIRGPGGVTWAVIRWDDSAWSRLGPEMNEEIGALAVTPDGGLVAGGGFTTVGGATVNRVARWDGSSWAPLATGVNGPVHALATSPDGSLVVGGEFTIAGGVPASSIARWNGSSWSALGTGVTVVRSLVVLPGGALLAGGGFTAAGGGSSTTSPNGTVRRGRPWARA